MKSKPRRLPPAVYALGLTSLLNDAASDMIYPLLPAFLAALSAGPGAGAAAGAAVLGIIEGAAELVSSIMKLVSGHVSDRVQRRKPFVVVGYVVAGLVRPFLAVVGSAGAVLAIRMVDRFGKGLRSSPRDALIADVVPPGQRGRAFGVHEAMDHAGAVLGPVAAAGLLWLGFGYPAIFLASAVPALLACVVVVVMVKEPAEQRIAMTPRTPRPGETVSGSGSGTSIPLSGMAPMASWRLLFPPAFRGYLAAVTVFSLAGSADVFLVMRAHEVGVRGMALPLLWGLHNGAKALATAYGGSLADRFGRRRAVAAGWTVYALVYLAFGWADSPAAVVALFLVYALHHALAAGAQKALVAELVPAAARARGYGAYHLCLGVTLLPASAVFGILYQRLGAAVAFGTGAGLALCGVALLPLSRGPRENS